MAKNFASVLDSLRAAGQERLQEVDSVYTINCDWLLEQFKHSQVSLGALTATTQATVKDAEEQQVCTYMLWVSLSASLAFQACLNNWNNPTEHCQGKQPANSAKGEGCQG